MPIAVIDDSGSGGDSRYFVLAGFSADQRTWESFAHNWKSVLDASPKIEYFKMKEAEGLRGQFAGLDRTQSDSKINRFIEVILGHDLWEVAVAIAEKDYREILQPVQPKSANNPYYAAFVAMVAGFSAIYRRIGVAEPIDFMFDYQEETAARARRNYASLRKWNPTWQLGRIGFNDDKKVLPLQAADLLAWQTRRFYCSNEGTRPHYRRLHERRHPLRTTVSRKTLQEMADATRANIPDLRSEFGDEVVDRFMAKVGVDRRR